MPYRLAGAAMPPPSTAEPAPAAPAPLPLPPAPPAAPGAPALPPALPVPPTTPPANLSPWAWAAAVVLGQPNAHRLVRAFFFGLIGLVSVLAGSVRACRG